MELIRKKKFNYLEARSMYRVKIGHTYQEAKKLLQTGCLVCFSGTPCQIAGLKNYLKKDYANLITVDLVCRGNPSPLLFRKYLEYQQIKYKNKVTGVKFRDKYYGYNYSTMTLDFEDERIQYHYGMEADLMLKFFFKGCVQNQHVISVYLRVLSGLVILLFLIVGMLNFT